MPQFSVYRNANPASKAAFPLLLDVQSDLLEDLQTRVVVPLTRAPTLVRKPLSGLTPLLEIDGEKFLMLTPQLAAVGGRILGRPVASLAGQRTAIVAAIDFLITGI